MPFCTNKNCVIFGTHDTTPMPEWPCRPKRKYNENKDSLGSPVGLAASNVNFSVSGKTADIIKARFATYLKAFARLHLNSELTWDAVLIDDIMKEGLSLYTLSESGKNEVDSPVTIYSPTESLILRKFELSGFTFHVELMPKMKFNIILSTEDGAKGDDNAAELTVENLKPALKECFRQKKYCIISSGALYLMIWHTKEAYFVFDACGRRLNDFKTDKDQGVAMLICLSTLENVRYLIANLSGLHATDPFIIREMKVVKVITPEGSILQRDYVTRTHQYEIVNDDYAYLKAGLHLTLNRNDLLRNRSGLPVAVAAITSSRIDHPATWDMKMVDRIICFGVNFCQNIWGQCSVIEPIDVKEFPTFFKMGQFHVTSELVDKKYEGIWRCVPGFKDSELAHSIKTAFEAGHNKLILQINYQMYAIWKKNYFIYLFDPYRHRIVGKSNESDIYEQMEKSGTVRMFRDFEVFMNVLNHILLDSNRTSKFYIHVMKVKNIQLGHKQDGSVKLSEVTKLDDKGEVMSINEHICFEESEQICQKALGEISDYEDEDLISDVVEMELRTSSSEPEVLEEEEAALGAVEELEGLESSSSGEEGDGHKKKGGKSKGGDAKGKGKGGKKGGGGGKKSKKGKGADAETTEKAALGAVEKLEGLESSSRGEKGGGHKKKGGKSKGGGAKGKDDKEGDGKKRNKDNDAETTDDEALKAKKLNETPDESDKDKSKGNKGDGDDDKTKAKGKGGDDDDKKKDKSKDRDKDKDKAGKDSGKQGGEDDESKLKEKGKTLGDEKDKDKNKTLGGEKDKVKDKALGGDKDEDKDKTHGDKEKDKGRKLGDDDKDDKAEENKGFDKIFSRTDVSGKDNDKIKPLEKVDNTKGKEDPRKGDTTDLDKDKNKDEDQLKDEDKDTNKDKDKDTAKDTNKDKDKVTAKDKDKDKSRDKLKDKGKHGGKENEQKAKKLFDDGAEADDENENDFFKKCFGHCLPNPTRYPGYLKHPVDMAVVGSESGSYESLCKLFHSGFKIANRILCMTPWGNFVIFRWKNSKCPDERHYFLYDGCTCNFNRFRHFDLSIGTAGLIRFEHLHNIIEHIRSLRKCRRATPKTLERKSTIDDICEEYLNGSINFNFESSIEILR